MKIQKCVCGHPIDDHIECEGNQVIAAECSQCECGLYEEDKNEKP